MTRIILIRALQAQNQKELHRKNQIASARSFCFHTYLESTLLLVDDDDDVVDVVTDKSSIYRGIPIISYQA